MRNISSVCFLLALCWTMGEAILCWECTSLDQTWCREYMEEPDLTQYRHQTVNCSGACMKMMALVDANRSFYVRTCDVTDGVPGTCHTGSHVLGIPRSTVCVCPTDRCNHAPKQHSGRIDVIISILFVFQTVTWCIKNS